MTAQSWRLIYASLIVAGPADQREVIIDDSLTGGLAVGPDGALYVNDDKGGVIGRISDPDL